MSKPMVTRMGMDFTHLGMLNLCEKNEKIMFILGIDDKIDYSDYPLMLKQ